MGIQILDEIGGEEMIRKVNKAFYDLVYQHPWIGQYFQFVPQEHIENQQTDFMVGAFGGPERYSGRRIPDAHMHIFVNEELFLLREQLLDQAFEQVQAPQLLVEKWKKIDRAFKSSIIKNSPDECQRRYNTDTILNFPDPTSYKKSA